MTTVTFLLREEHLRLLQECYVQWQDDESGAPEIDPKRPYGNSDVAQDVAEILSVGDQDRKEDMLEWHRETELALQIILSTRSFRLGRYELLPSTSPPKWRWISNG